MKVKNTLATTWPGKEPTVAYQRRMKQRMEFGQNASSKKYGLNGSFPSIVSTVFKLFLKKLLTNESYCLLADTLLSLIVDQYSNPEIIISESCSKLFSV